MMLRFNAESRFRRARLVVLACVRLRRAVRHLYVTADFAELDISAPSDGAAFEMPGQLEIESPTDISSNLSSGRSISSGERRFSNVGSSLSTPVNGGSERRFSN